MNLKVLHLPKTEDPMVSDKPWALGQGFLLLLPFCANILGSSILVFLPNMLTLIWVRILFWSYSYEMTLISHILFPLPMWIFSVAWTTRHIEAFSLDTDSCWTQIFSYCPLWKRSIRLCSRSCRAKPAPRWGFPSPQSHRMPWSSCLSYEWTCNLLKLISSSIQMIRFFLEIIWTRM